MPKPMMLVVVALLAVIAVGGYMWYQEDQKGPMEKFGEDVDRTVNELGESLNNLGN